MMSIDDPSVVGDGCANLPEHETAPLQIQFDNLGVYHVRRARGSASTTTKSSVVVSVRLSVVSVERDAVPAFQLAGAPAAFN